MAALLPLCEGRNNVSRGGARRMTYLAQVSGRSENSIATLRLFGAITVVVFHSFYVTQYAPMIAFLHDLGGVNFISCKGFSEYVNQWTVSRQIHGMLTIIGIVPCVR